jgi:hypothetical protein
VTWGKKVTGTREREVSKLQISPGDRPGYEKKGRERTQVSDTSS